jgi:hypothetical protein
MRLLFHLANRVVGQGVQGSILLKQTWVLNVLFANREDIHFHREILVCGTFRYCTLGLSDHLVSNKAKNGSFRTKRGIRRRG